MQRVHAQSVARLCVEWAELQSKSMMYVKVHSSYRHVVAICDSDLLGKKYEEDNRQLDVRENFFKGEEHTFNEVVKLIQLESREDATFNIVGKESIQAAHDAGIILKENVGNVQGIPFTLVLI